MGRRYLDMIDGAKVGSGGVDDLMTQNGVPRSRFASVRRLMGKFNYGVCRECLRLRPVSGGVCDDCQEYV